VVGVGINGGNSILDMKKHRNREKVGRKLIVA